MRCQRIFIDDDINLVHFLFWNGIAISHRVKETLSRPAASPIFQLRSLRDVPFPAAAC